MESCLMYVYGLSCRLKNQLEKWFPLQGERAQSLKCTYVRFQKLNRNEKEETEQQQQTY